MRIISGFARGCRLAAPPAKTRNIRPTSDRAREALFNILQHRLKESTVLDLFSGTGAVGLEAFSRGARQVTFVDSNRLAIKLIRENIGRCSSGRDISPDALTVISHDLTKGLPRSLPVETSFDIIFADPPYEHEISLALLQALHNSSLLSEGGLVVIEQRRSATLPASVASFTLTDTRQYGEARFWFYSQQRKG